MAKAKAEAAQARAAHTQKEIELKVEQARVQANLDALNDEKEKDAAIAEANALMAGLQDMGFEVCSKAGSQVPQSVKDQRVAAYVSVQASLCSKGLSVRRAQAKIKLLLPQTLTHQVHQAPQTSGAPLQQSYNQALNSCPVLQHGGSHSQQNVKAETSPSARTHAHKTPYGASYDHSTSTGDLIKYLARSSLVMFYIVEFLETQEVEVVPALWVEKEICQWPAQYRRDELVKAIRTTYKAARLKLPQAETQTDLQTAEEEDVDDIPKKKRKRLPNIHFESDDEDLVKQKGLLPPAPKITGPNFAIESAIKRRVQKLETPKHMTSPEPRHSVTSPEPRRAEKSPEPSRSMGNSEAQQSGTVTLSDLLNKYSSLLHRILTNQEMMMDQLKVILMNMQKMGEPAHGQDPIDRDLLPLKDLTSLLALEKRLREEADLKKNGVDVKDSVWRVMGHCITNSLGKQLNWRGINGKTAFHKLQLKDVITGTVRNNRLTAAATDQEIETFIKKWLHLSSDRDGGRREREKRRRSQDTCLQDCHDDTDGPSQGGQIL
ncbi:hypothetical protein G5714_006189 [Onychostoma macrolepis]|uniref:Uncharacterized protein n=1 Tax=Onychostoma macrolepis TaxID=369639 RepID=A0A7J6D3A7_9TELE|nr:hypothetical protein G5714_006189 [Onychostoma macrolepis]